MERRIWKERKIQEMKLMAKYMAEGKKKWRRSVMREEEEEKMKIWEKKWNERRERNMKEEENERS